MWHKSSTYNCWILGGIMKGSQALVLSIFIVFAAWMSGCGSSSAGNNQTNNVGNTAISSCTTTSAAQSCIPGLGTYGTIVEFRGQIAVSNAGLGQTYVKAF